MADLYSELLSATIEHLQAERARGVRYVNVNQDLLSAFSRPPAVRPLSGSSIAKPISPSPQPIAETSVPKRATISPASPHKTTIPPAPAKAVPAGAEPPPPTRKLSKEEKEAAFTELRKRVLTCTKCPHLVKSRTQVVFGVGDIHSKLMFVGEAPGADEDAQGEPFVGKAGQLLTKIIAAMGLTREQVYIGNILKCRPDTPGQTSGNRKPTPEEMSICSSYLHEQIDLIQPKVLVALGSTAVEGLLGGPVMITKMRGAWRSYRGIPLMPTYHPSYLMRNQTMALKREVWEDMLSVMEKLSMPISEKQKGYFLSAGA